ncbi:MAG: N-formylglutamate deformylase [Roseibium sp.]
MILVDEGQSPLILCLPHSGTVIPNAVEKRLNATGRLQADLAWRLERVFDFHGDLDATVLRSSISRYVIDLDRDPETPVSAAADPARALCPATTLDGKRIYQDGEEPGPTEVEQRVLLFHAPFHRALHRQVDRLLRLHRKVIVLDCQSMRSHIKGVTDKGLPVVSIGTAGGASCDPDLRNLVAGSFSGQQGYTVSVDEQTRGGFITKSYGRPERGVHVLTLLLAQRIYLRHESPPFEPDRTRVERLHVELAEALGRIGDWAGSEGGASRIEPAVEARAETAAEETEPVQAQAPGGSPQEIPEAAADDGGGQARVIPMDPTTLPRVGKVETGQVEDGPVTPVLVAE